MVAALYSHGEVTDESSLSQLHLEEQLLRDVLVIEYDAGDNGSGVAINDHRVHVELAVYDATFACSNVCND